MKSRVGISIAIPTFNRGDVVLKTISLLLEMCPAPREILVVDQTAQQPQAVRDELWHHFKAGHIRLLHRRQPSIPGAMNTALVNASEKLVLFLDDDIVPASRLLEGHANAFKDDSALWATVGRVVQPWQQAASVHPPRQLKGLRRDFDFPFHSTIDADVENVMAGNLCVHRERAVSIGGFDEQFAGPAYRFESDFARRVIAAGGRIRFVGSASIDHLHAATGGTRSAGDHMKSASPQHGFGDYYYAFIHGTFAEAWAYSLKRLFREIRTRFHLTHPWWIPVKFLGELRALIDARRAARKGPKFLSLEKAA